MASVTFRSQVLVSDGEGSWFLTPGTAAMEHIFEDLPGGTRAIAKEAGLVGPTLMMDVVFHVTNPATVMSRLAGIASDGTAGTLAVPNQGSYTNCVMLPPSWHQMKRADIPTSGAPTVAWRVPVTLAFRKLG